MWLERPSTGQKNCFLPSGQEYKSSAIEHLGIMAEINSTLEDIKVPQMVISFISPIRPSFWFCKHRLDDGR